MDLYNYVGGLDSLKGLSLNSEGYIRINSQEWGDIIILRMALFQELMTNMEVKADLGQQEEDQKKASEVPSNEYLLSREFGNWAYGRLKEKEMTQGELAKILKTTQATISRIVRCSQKIIPSTEIRLKIYNFLRS